MYALKLFLNCAKTGMLLKKVAFVQGNPVLTTANLFETLVLDQSKIPFQPLVGVS